MNFIALPYRGYIWEASGPRVTATSKWNNGEKGSFRKIDDTGLSNFWPVKVFTQEYVNGFLSIDIHIYIC